MKDQRILVIGGGIIGASVAYHLASRGCRNIRVIDRGEKIGAGSTGRATGGFRCQFSSPINVQLSMLSREKLLRFEEELGIDPGFRPYGYLFVAQSHRGIDALREAQKVQKQAGLHSAQMVSPEEICAINPYLSSDGILGGSFCPSDGLIRPLNILQGYTLGAQRLGVQFDYGIECLEFSYKNEGSQSRIAAIHTSKERIEADLVINAAGAWAGELASRGGLHLPVTPSARSVAMVKEPRILKNELPMTIFVEDGFHFRVRDDRVLLLLPSLGDPSIASAESPHPKWIDAVTQIAKSRIPSLAQATISLNESWVGLYEMSPDHHAILGSDPTIPNLYLVNGSSGHGVMHSPALGQLLSEIILDGSSRTLDTHCLRPSRFAEGKPNPMSELL